MENYVLTDEVDILYEISHVCMSYFNWFRHLFVSDFLTFQSKMWPSLEENSWSDLKFEQLPPSPASARPAKSSPTLRSWAQLSNCQVFSSINWTDCCPKFYHLLRRFLRSSFTPVLYLAATTTSWWLVSSSSFYMMLSFVSIFDILELIKHHDFAA